MNDQSTMTVEQAQIIMKAYESFMKTRSTRRFFPWELDWRLRHDEARLVLEREEHRQSTVGMIA